MATFRLQPCKLRDGWFVPQKVAPITLDWAGLRSRVAPSASVRAQTNLRQLAVQGYVGTVRQPNGQITNFVLRNADLSGDVRGLTKRDPMFSQRLVAVYRVEAVDWDDRTIEVSR